MEDMEKDLVDIFDDDGNKITMEVLDYFFYEGEEYALMTEFNEECEACEKESCEECGEIDAYIMKVEPVGDDEEQFVPVDEELQDKLIELVQSGAYDDDEYEFEDAEDEEEDK